MCGLLFIDNGAMAVPMFYFLGRAVWENRWELWPVIKNDFLVCSIWVFMPCGVLSIAVMGGTPLPLSTYMVDVPILLVVIGGVPLVIAGTSWFCERFPELGRRLLLRPRSGGR